MVQLGEYTINSNCEIMLRLLLKRQRKKKKNNMRKWINKKGAFYTLFSLTSREERLCSCSRKGITFKNSLNY
jgi:hypothetical protein